MGKTENNFDTGDIIDKIMNSLKDELKDIRAEIKIDLKAEIESIKADLKAEIDSLKDLAPHPPEPHRFSERFMDQFMDHFPSFDTFRENIEDSRDSEKFNITDFSRIHVSGMFDVVITHSDQYGISVDAEKSLFRNLDVSKEGDILRVRHSRHIGWRARLSRPKVLISMPLLTELEVSGATNVMMSEFNSSQNFRLALSGASNITGDIVAGNADFDLSGASKAILTGSAGDVIIKASGANRMDLRDFSIENLAVRLSGASNLTARISGRLDARLSGASNFSWIGEPVIGDIRTSGAARLHKE